jgi:2-C-methyl-D-erythritol 4-phosphate cytidylyltransferase
MSFAAILVAAGSGERLGAAVPKALVEVGGRPLVAHAATRLLAAGTTHLVVVGPAGDLDAVGAALPEADVAVDVVAGGATRADSVRAGLAAVPAAEEVVAVHDAARAFAPATLVRRTVGAVIDDVVAAAPALPVGDTLKRVDGDTVTGTVDRAGLVAVQTPQVFRRDVLVAAHRDAPQATDDLALVERLVAGGEVAGRVVVVPGAAAATKVTWPHDLVLVAALAEVPA